MKKIVLLSLVVFSLGVFATEVKAETWGSWGFDLKNTDTQSFALGKTYTVASYETNGTKLTGVVRWEKVLSNAGGAAALDYLYLDTPITGGTLRLGLQRLGLGNYGKGVPQTTPFLTATCLKAEGVSYASNMFGVSSRLFLAKSVFLLDEQAGAGEGKGAIALLVDTKMGSSIGVIYQSDTSVDKNGTSVYADYVASLLGVNLQLQGFYDLSDDALTAAVNNYGVDGTAFVKARQLINVAADMQVPVLGTLYGFFLSNVNAANNAVLISQYAVGVEYMLSKAVNLVVEFGETDKTAGKSQKLKASFEFLI